MELGLPAGTNSAADLPKIAKALRARGYKEADINKIMGEKHAARHARRGDHLQNSKARPRINNVINQIKLENWNIEASRLTEA